MIGANENELFHPLIIEPLWEWSMSSINVVANEKE